MECEYCGAASKADCAPLCPDAHARKDPNRVGALVAGAGIASSDWIDAALAHLAALSKSGELTISIQREMLTDMLSLHHRYVHRVYDRDVRAEARRQVDGDAIAAAVEAEGRRVRGEVSRELERVARDTRAKSAASAPLIDQVAAELSSSLSLGDGE